MLYIHMYIQTCYPHICIHVFLDDFYLGRWRVCMKLCGAGPWIERASGGYERLLGSGEGPPGAR